MRFCRWSVPWVRVVATSSAKPAPASQAENARRNIGEAVELVEFSSRVHKDSARKRESIIASKQRSADNRWVR